MPKRHAYSASAYKQTNNQKTPGQFSMETMSEEFKWFANLVSSYLWTLYSMMNLHYVAIGTVIFVVVLSFMLPDISHKIHASSELKTMNKVLDMMSKEINQAEVACLTAADEISYLHCSVQDDNTETPKDLQDLSVSSGCCMHSTQSEPVQIEKKIGFFRRIFFPSRNTSHKEITIMSYVYTDSFDKKH